MTANNIYEFESVKKLLDDCEYNKTSYRLFKNSDPSPYATCFAIFISHFYKKKILYSSRKIKYLINELSSYKKKYNICSKAYMQLLSFSLSAIWIIDKTKIKLLERQVKEVISVFDKNLTGHLNSLGASKGRSQTGNISMLFCLFLIIDSKYFNTNRSKLIIEWKNYFGNTINVHGFWGKNLLNPYLQFQNSYHQLEIFDYLNINIKFNERFLHVIKLIDKNGHFSPYPGGGGCYDYDAVYILTKNIKFMKDRELFLLKKKLKLLRNDLVKNNYEMGYGFCESKNATSQALYLEHILFSKSVFQIIEKLKHFYFITKSKGLVKTHWTKKHRQWSEQNLWDTWFRLLTIARIDQILLRKNLSERFINFPGIGHL